MVPWKDGGANDGHSCVKGRFAWGYATHKDRITRPMIRASITDPWREVSWEEAIAHAAAEFRASRPSHGRGFHRRHHLVALHQRGDLPGAEAGARGLFGNNNVDTCARVCHSPTGYGLKPDAGGPRPARRTSSRWSRPT
jgi:formate dehydrogenase major subunit